MRYFIIILLLILSINSFGQKTEIESVINQIASQEVPENFKFYYLMQESLQQPKEFDSLQLYQKTKLLRQDLNFPLELIVAKRSENVDWKDFNLENIKYIGKETHRSSPPTMKQVYFVKYNIKQSELNSLLKNKNPHTLYIRKKWLWNKKRVWNEVVKAWKKDEEQNIEEKMYFSFSKPTFSSDFKYARVSIFIYKRCNGNRYTVIYKNENGIWKKLIEYNQVVSKTFLTHVRCGDVLVTYEKIKNYRQHR